MFITIPGTKRNVHQITRAFSLKKGMNQQQIAKIINAFEHYVRDTILDTSSILLRLRATSRTAEYSKP